MDVPAVLCITQDSLSAPALAADLNATGWRVIATEGAGEAIALLYVSRNVQAVLLDQRGNRTPHLALARILKGIRAEVRIFLMFSRRLEPLPDCIDGCLQGGDGVSAIRNGLRAIAARFAPAV